MKSKVVSIVLTVLFPQIFDILFVVLVLLFLLLFSMFNIILVPYQNHNRLAPLTTRHVDAVSFI